MSRSGEPHTPHDADHDPAVETFLVMQTTQSWNDVPYTHYPAGTPQLAVMRFHIPPHSYLPWHTHDVPNVAYLLEGVLTVEDRETGLTRVVRAGEAFGESVDSVHRGYTEDLAAEVIAIYAGAEGVPLSRTAD